MCTGRMLEHQLLPSELIPRCLDVLREVIQNERDLIMMVVEIMDELRDPAAKRAADGEDGEAQDVRALYLSFEASG